MISMTAADDVARFVVRSTTLREWPSQLLVRGDRLSVRETVDVVERVRGMRLTLHRWITADRGQDDGSSRTLPGIGCLSKTSWWQPRDQVMFDDNDVYWISMQSWRAAGTMN
ncbi:hypothetical protein MRB53_037517 [Persea americana]|nr:hypothetical protein MRB53_037517 [Persea americana]